MRNRFSILDTAVDSHPVGVQLPDLEMHNNMESSKLMETGGRLGGSNATVLDSTEAMEVQHPHKEKRQRRLLIMRVMPTC